MDDVQSWWEIPCIAHFCSLFRLYFDLIDFDIEELEEALLTDSAEEVASSWLQDLIVQLLKGCFDSKQDEITTSNYQMYLRRLFRKKCEEGSTKNNPFESDATFHSLPLRTKVEILYDLCDFRLENEDVPESLKSLESDSLRVEPLGRDSGGSTYWYFYGTRLYREDYGDNGPGQKRGRKGKEEKVATKWQVVCYTEEDWQVLTRKFKNCKSLHEKNLHRTLSNDFLPELPRLFAEKEKLQRKRMLDKQLRRARPVPADEMPVSQKKGKEEEEERKPNGEMDEEESRRKEREEQEKADRLLAEEIEREERKARLHLRERRGGAVPSSSTTTPPKSSTPPRKSKGGRSSSSSSKSPSKSPVKEGKKKEERKGHKVLTTNSLAASIKTAVLSKKKASSVKGSLDDDDEDSEDEKDSTSRRNKKGRESSSEGEEDEEELGSEASDSETKKGKGRKARSRSPKVKSKKPKGKREESEKRSKSKEKKKRKTKKEKVKEKEKEKERDSSRGKEKKKKKEKADALVENHHVPPPSSTSVHGMSKTKVKGSVLFSHSEEDLQIGMHKVIESIKNHGDAWPFMNPVDEDYAPNYYRVITSPMDLQTMEDKLDNQEYCSLEEFVADFQRIVDNCIKYNGPSSEYTEMAETLQDSFNKAVQRYIVPDESDEEISIEYNNLGAAKKRSRVHSHSKKEVKSNEHKKENEPALAKKPKSTETVKPEKREKSSDKKKLKHKLLRHHSKDSETIENLHSATAETLKDFDRWLDDPPKPSSGFVSSGAAAFDSLRSRILEDDNDRGNVTKHSTNNHRTSEEKETKSSPFPSKTTGKKRSLKEDEDEEDAPPSKLPKKSEKHKKEEKGSKKKGVSGSNKEKEKEKAEKEKEKDVRMKDSKKEKHKDKEKEKDKRHHKRHRHSSSSSRALETPSPTPHKSNKAKKHSHSSVKSSEFYSSSPSDTSEKEPKKGVEESKKPPLKKSKSLLSSLKGSGPVKRPTPNKPVKHNSFHTESKFKSTIDSLLASKLQENSEKAQQSSKDGAAPAEKPEKKKCLLLNDTPSDKEGGPKLSLGAVLSTDAIKLGEFKTSENEEEDEYDLSVSKGNSKVASKGENGISPEDIAAKAKEAENEEMEEEQDRKLEPSKGFKPEKCMPNLSAWIKAFGGPSKTSGGAGGANNSPATKKVEHDPKSKFKVMGRSVDALQSNEVIHKASPVKHSTSVPKSKAAEANWNSHGGKEGSEDVPPPTTEAHISKKHHRHRKMSTSSLSSQSETGSPQCFNNVEGGNTQIGMGSVVNPPRWVDDHWAANQSQSPSASSHVSSQSPANSPFSPAINSPPHTPQTPPRPGPVRVGFYQDITSQHSSPEKANEHSNSNSNVASPSTPPTPTNAHSGRREGGNGKGYGNYPSMVYGSRYASSTPSPNVAPPSNPNIQSPSPGGMGAAVDSPQGPNSPHSPAAAGPDYSRGSSGNFMGRGPAPPQTGSVSGPVRPSSSGGHNQPSISPYPPPSHYQHPDSNPPANNVHAHQAQPHGLNQVQAHSQQHQQPYEGRYPPHNYHHHQMNASAGTPSSLPSTTSSAYTQNLTVAHSQSQRPTAQGSPYSANYSRNLNLAPNVYNHPMSSDSAMSRYYKPSVSGGELSLTSSAVAISESGSGVSGSSSSSRGRHSRSSANDGGSASEARPPSGSLDPKLAHAGDLNGFQWPHNLASLSQIVNSIPNPMNAVGMANAYRQYDPAMVESMAKYQRETGNYTNLSASSSSGGLQPSKSCNTMNPPAAHSQPADKLPSDELVGSRSRQSSKAEGKSSSRSNSKSGQSMVAGSAFSFSSLSPADLALYPKEISEGSLYSASPPTLAHRPDLYPTSTSNFHSSFSTSSRSTAGGVPTPSISHYQIPPFIGSHPSPYQPQTSQPFAHTQPPRGLVDPYQQFFQNSPHVMGLLPPTGYPYPHGLGFNRPGWI